MFLFGERGEYVPPGVVGGKPAALNRFTYQQDDGDHTPPMKSKMVGIKLKKGQRVHLETPGGGGYGQPFEREPEVVRRDVELGFVSRESALKDYGVVLDAAGTIDEIETAKSRDYK